MATSNQGRDQFNLAKGRNHERDDAYFNFNWTQKMFRGLERSVERTKAMTPPTPEAEKLAERIVDVLGMVWDGGGREKAVQKVASLISGALEEAKAHWDMEAFGEGIMLDGKRIRPDEVYKSIEDYVKEAIAKERDRAALIALKFVEESSYPIEKMSAEVIAAKIRSGEAAE